jgi:hypothetical protein
VFVLVSGGCLFWENRGQKPPAGMQAAGVKPNYPITFLPSQHKSSNNPTNGKYLSCFFENFFRLICFAGDACCVLSEMCHTTGKHCRRQPAAMPAGVIRLAGGHSRLRW